MLDGLLKSKFYNKCKTDMKMVKARIEMIKKKRNAMQKYLRNDVADLLKNGLDVNAYGRAEGLLLEQNRTVCYEFIEQCSILLLSNLEIINKQREECPEEYREAVASLSFAAARFADLPELRDLRTMFSERYGESLNFYVNKEFAEKLNSGIPSKDQKLQLLLDISQESGLEWNSKALENKLYNEATGNEASVEETNDSKYSFLPEIVNGSVHEKHRLPKEARRVLPVKDIIVDTIRKDEKQNEPVSQKSESNDNTPKYKWIPPPYTKADPAECEAKGPEQEDIADKNAKPVPKSVRRRKARSPKENAAGSSSSGEQEKSTDMSEEKTSQGWKFLRSFGEQDEEETMLDKLLRHYSRKKWPNENVKPAEGRESIRSRNRSSSALAEVTSPTETPKRHARAVSLQPEMLSGDAHVHPNLPDYDDFLARLKALRRHS